MCDREHAPTSARRLLYSVPPPDGRDDEPLLCAWVSYCEPASPEDDAAAFVTLAGQLDARTTPTSERMLNSFTDDVRNVILNLFTLRRIDSEGLAFLRRLHDRVLARNGFFTIHDPSAIVERALLRGGPQHRLPTCRPAPTRRCITASTTTAAAARARNARPVRPRAFDLQAS